MLFILDDGILSARFQVRVRKALGIKIRGDRFLSESSAAELDDSCIVWRKE